MSILDFVGNTPTVELWQGVYAKLEMKNPSGSVKDRAAKFILESAALPRGSKIVEATSGNFGISLAFVSAVKGYSFTALMPSGASAERKRLIELYGGEVIRVDGSMAEAVQFAEKIAEREGAFLPSQFTNPNNPLAYYLTTGREIYSDSRGMVDILVSGVGSGGTISGTARYLREKKPSVRVVAVLPEEGSVIDGLGAGFVPPILDERMIDEKICVSRDDAINRARLAAKKHGISVGISSGAALSAAYRLSVLPENEGKMIYVILPDGADRYYSTALFGGET